MQAHLSVEDIAENRFQFVALDDDPMPEIAPTSVSFDPVFYQTLEAIETSFDKVSEAISALPVGHVSHTNNPHGLRKVVTLLQKVDGDCTTMLNSILDSHPDAHLEDATRNKLVGCKFKFTSILLRYYDSRLKMVYKFYVQERRALVTKSKQFVLSDELVKIIMKITFCSYLTMEPTVKTYIDSRTASSFPCVVESGMALYSQPILEYSLVLLMNAQLVFGRKLVSLIYNEELIGYFELLVYRLSRFYSLDASMYENDQVNWRVEIPGTPKQRPDDVRYVLAQEFIAVITPWFRGVSLKFSKMRGLVDKDHCYSRRELYFVANPRNAFGDGIPRTRCIKILDTTHNRCKEWFSDKAIVMLCTTKSDSVANQFFESCLAPGEREVYKMEKPTESNSATAILVAYRQASAYTDMQNACSRSIKSIFDAELNKEPESQLLQLALSEVLDLYMRSIIRGSWHTFRFFESEIGDRYTELTMIALRPVLVQLFNHFQLLYKGRLYLYNSLKDSLVAWLMIMREDFDHIIDSDIRGSSVKIMFDEMIPPEQDMDDDWDSDTEAEDADKARAGVDMSDTSRSTVEFPDE
jgi:hypothetical protein